MDQKLYRDTVQRGVTGSCHRTVCQQLLSQGHEGPLCGSCKASYGRSHSFLCEECFSGFVNAILILLSFLVLLCLSAIGIRGNLISCPSLTQPSEDDVHSVSRHSSTSACSVPVNIEMAEMMITGRRSERCLDPGPSRRPNPEADPHLDTNDDPGHTDAELAKWKAIEVFKVTVRHRRSLQGSWPP